jgi:hypothetical protein
MKQNQNGWWSRNVIALIITVAVVGITIGIGIVCLCKGFDDGMDFIGKSLLPLWGTWIGTVLAFYFGKANFDAASKSYQEVIKTLSSAEKMAGIKVTEVMIVTSKIEFLNLEKEKEKKISDILKYERFKKYNRFAVFEPDNILKCIIHRSTFHQFIALKVEEGMMNEAIKALTLNDILNEPNAEIKNILAKGYDFVSQSATLLDAKNAMDAIAECQDIFVSQTGKISEPVLGLITNNIIMEKSKV